MSTVKVDTITASDGTSPVTLTKQSAAKAYLSMDSSGGSTATFHGSFNTSSVTDTAVGKYDQNFTNSFTGANYSGVGICHANVNIITNVNNDFFGSYAAGASGIVLYNSIGSAYTDADVSTVHHGDLA